MLIVVAALALTPAYLHADVITFEDLPDANMFLGGGQNVGTFYPGVDFGPDVTGFNFNDFVNPAAFPAHSGNIVVWSATSNTTNIGFSKALTSVGIYYTSIDNLTLEAFDGHGKSLGSILGSPNTDGFVGTSNPLFLNNLSDIESITLTGVAQDFVFDDLTFTPQSGPPSGVPEPSSLFLLSTGVLALAAFARRKRAPACSAQSRSIEQS
jgi:hypothetical protein